MSKAWYDDIVRKSKCDVCGKVKPLQWDTDKSHLCHDCLINTEKGLEVFLTQIDFEGLTNQFEKETGKSIFKKEFREELRSGVDVFVYVCDKCGESLDMEIDSEFAKIPFESSWACKCGNLIKIKWNGKELKYL